MFRHFLDIAQMVKKLWIFALLFYCLCIKDFIDIYIYSILKITERTLWMLQAVGLFRKINDSKFSRLNKIAQTDIIRKRDAQSSPFECHRYKKLYTSLQTSPPCKLKLSLSPPKIQTENDEIKTAEISHKLPEKQLENSPAILELEAEIPKTEAFPSAIYSQTPLCNINLSLTPTVKSKETDNLSPEERNFLKRKWQSWKLRQYIRKMKTRPIFLKYEENSEEVFTCPENTTFSEWSPDDQKKRLCEEPGTPNRHGCCPSLVTKLKSKLHRESDGPSIYYKRF
ncbi:hypothetical protein HNY73_011239 [Argiope bruennichi]|uniref:Uncharacterized protein n=2 Tax=Argiope bruennichi TaxID=94029 RepID=A0A8T0F5Y7_ARGBR|nr:hypothetical protein HNY73_011239 [Argiope bruennichi]